MENKPLKSQKDAFAKYIRYSGLGFQMIATIGLFTWLGDQTDRYYQNEKPTATAVFALIGVCLSIYWVIRGVAKNRDPEQ